MLTFGIFGISKKINLNEFDCHDLLHLIWIFTILLPFISPHWTLEWLLPTFGSTFELNFTPHPFLRCNSSHLQAFSFTDQNAADHYRSLRQELNPKKESETAAGISKVPQCPGTAFENGKKGTAGIKKQVVLTRSQYWTNCPIFSISRFHWMMRSSLRRGAKRPRLFVIRWNKDPIN